MTLRDTCKQVGSQVYARAGRALSDAQAEEISKRVARLSPLAKKNIRSRGEQPRAESIQREAAELAAKRVLGEQLKAAKRTASNQLALVQIRSKIADLQSQGRTMHAATGELIYATDKEADGLYRSYLARMPNMIKLIEKGTRFYADGKFDVNRRQKYGLELARVLREPGYKSPDPLINQAADEFKAIAGEAREEFNRIGGTIGDLGDLFGTPQMWHPMLAMKAVERLTGKKRHSQPQSARVVQLD